MAVEFKALRFLIRLPFCLIHNQPWLIRGFSTELKDSLCKSTCVLGYFRNLIELIEIIYSVLFCSCFNCCLIYFFGPGSLYSALKKCTVVVSTFLDFVKKSITEYSFKKGPRRGR